ncbi:MAG TPA: hypothetical protein VIM12_18025 [Noviherbaspirillum sp.]|jgi:hypothetical protein|uniref:hypothetical protein n=1 Tax=Noviherbaspirillum sp. TaxID=1926288 RepID=UPI002F921FC0
MKPLAGLLRLLPMLLLAACAGTREGPPFTMHPGDRIGLLVETTDAPVHTHYHTDAGATVRSAHAYPYAWQLDAAVTEVIRRQLTVAGFTVVDLEAQGMRHGELDGVVAPSGSQWAPPAGPIAEQLRQQGVRAVVLVRDARTLAALDCADGPCDEHLAEGPGLYSRSVGNATSFRAVAGFDWHVYLLDPPGDLGAAQPLRSTLRMPAAELHGFRRPANLYAMTETELAPVRKRLLEYVEATAEDVVGMLGGRRVVEVEQASVHVPDTR